ncbi:MAG: hypothetical protein EOP06_09845 [Proteobacteria bacterium]|nr:MAG: hypothetical protein EOP06_09845 [Pseudomonadota bacterium]
MAPSGFVRRHVRSQIAGMNEAHISRVSVKKLFGKYSFPDIYLNVDGRSNANIAFLYGDNGVGKTTILKLIYSLLAPQSNDGRRGILARTKFSSFSVEFSNGQVVKAARPEGEYIGPYSYEFRGPVVNNTFLVKPEPGGHVPATGIDPGLISALISVSPTIVFINDHRTVRSTYPPWDAKNYLRHTRRAPHGVMYQYDESGGATPIDVDSIVNTGLDSILAQTHDFITDRAIRTNSRANVGVGKVYVDIATAVASSSRRTSGISDRKLATFLDRLAKLQSKLVEFSKYGLLEGQHLDMISGVVSQAAQGRRAALMDVLEPYVSSIEKRIDSNAELLDIMSSFELCLNRFLNKKSLTFRLGQPIRFVDDDQHTIPAAELSSGERHLVYLCCASLLSRDRNTLILVDEPELSLNYKWQRALVESLLSLAADRSQFIMATHSFEIISKYRDNAVELDAV